MLKRGYVGHETGNRNLKKHNNTLAMSHSQFVRDLILRACYTMLTEPPPCPTLSECVI